MAPSFVACENSAEADVSTPGAITPPMKRPVRVDDFHIGGRAEIHHDHGAPYSAFAATASATRSAPIS